MTETFIKKGQNASVKIPEDNLGKLMLDSLKQKNPNDVALIDAFTEKTLTYGEILEESIKCTLSLKKHGIEKGDVIAILSENDLRYTIPVIASWCIGAVVNLLNPAYTLNELEYTSGKSLPKIMFVSEASSSKALELMNKHISSLREVICFGKSNQTKSYEEFLKEADDSSTKDAFFEDIDRMEDIAAILCSSGTSGLPKGVMLTHENMRLSFYYMTDPLYMNMAENDVTINALPYFHIFGLYLVMSGLKTSTKMINLAKFKPEVYLESISKFKVNKLYIVPYLAVFLAKSELALEYDLKSVEDVVCGAAPLSKEIEDVLAQRLEIPLVRQIYGMTECSGGITIFPTTPIHKPKSAGIIVPNMVVKIVSTDGNETILGPNEKGEIRMNGPGVMKGYVNDAASTEEAFDADGFIKSGDIGYYDEEGHFYVVDRLKELIKYKGFQVPPAEIENILLSHEAIKDAAVVGKPDERSGELPTAFVVLQPGAKVEEEEILNLISSHVSFQKHLHGGVIFVEEIPKNSLGKILRRKLREILI